MSTELHEIIGLLRRIVEHIEGQDGAKRSPSPRRNEDERVALAVVAIARGASSYQEIADQLGVSRGTVSRNPGIRRAMEASVRDRRPADNREAEDYRWQQ
jgi:DNA invertase Pin-like site-specific DNA recombinase